MPVFIILYYIIFKSRLIVLPYKDYILCPYLLYSTMLYLEPDL
jgi:hypothetical protein